MTAAQLNFRLLVYSLPNVELHTETELGAMASRMKSAQLQTINLTNDDLAKDHLRYFMGGRSNVKDELLCRFIFPERPGALMKFLDCFSPRWNISLFHYRAQGAAGANVLVASKCLAMICKNSRMELMISDTSILTRRPTSPIGF